MNQKFFSLLLLLCPVWLLAQATVDDAAADQIARAYLVDHAKVWQLTQRDIGDLVLADRVYSKHNGVWSLYYNQRIHGIPVFNAMYNASVLPTGKVILANNRLLPHAESRTSATQPVLQAQDALKKVLAHFGLPTETGRPKMIEGNKYVFDKAGRSVIDIPVRLVYFPQGEKLRLAWDVLIQPPGRDGWFIEVDALTGELFHKQNMTLHCHFEPGQYRRAAPRCLDEAAAPAAAPAQSQLGDGASYRVFPYSVESPIYGSQQLLTEPSDAMASPYGWHDVDGQDGAEYTITRGNNVHAYLDLSDSNVSSGDEPDGGPSLTFDFPYDPNAEASTMRKAAVTNLFYMNNFMHDFVFHYGMDEAGGNFQEHHYTNVPAYRGHDYVLAQAQDGGGTNNANFFTPPDGSNPTIQMYVWVGQAARYLNITSPAGISGTYRTGTADFGPEVTSTPVTGDLILMDDGSAQYPTLGCSQTSQDLSGKLVLIDRGTCYFSEKAVMAQAAGAAGVIIVNFEEGILNMTSGPGYDGSLTIPIVFISQSDGAKIKNALANGTVTGAIVKNQTNGPDSLDADFDNGVIAHEYGHGVSNRLTGGPLNTTCLFNDEQMGEGWSDFFTLVTSAKATDDGTEARGIGNYVNGDGPDGTGIRRYPYSTDMSINPLTYYDVLNTTAPHPLGEVWTACLWDLYWAMVDKYGFDSDIMNGTGGNNKAIQLVMDGMKMQACEPGFIDGRNAILAADSADFNGENACLIWEVFARRGLGYSASQGSPDDRNDGKEAYDTPLFCKTQLGIEKSMTPVIDAGDTIDVTLTVYNFRGTDAPGVVVTDLIPDGCTFVDGSASVAPDVTGQTLSFDLGAMADQQVMTITYKMATDPNAKSTSLFFDDFEATGDKWLADGISGDNYWDWEASDLLEYAHSGVKSYYIEGTDGESNQYLELVDPVQVSATQPILRFYHGFDTKPGEDGGIVEISTDDGLTWHDLGDRFFRVPYVGKIAYSTFVIPNLKAFWGKSPGIDQNPKQYVESMVDLSDYIGQSIKLRYHFATGSSTDDDPSKYWIVDDVEVMDMLNYNSEACVTSHDGDSNCARADAKGTVVNSDHLVGFDEVEDPVVAFDVQPNPATDLVNVRIGAATAQQATLQVTGTDGKILSRQPVRLYAGTQIYQLSVSDLAPGMYFVQLITDTGVSVQKVVKR